MLPRSGLAILSASALLAGSTLTRPEAPSPDHETEQCRRNLHYIYQAIQSYRRAYHDLPNELSDLLPQFLSETRYLICPAAQRLGLTSADLTEWGAAGPSTYGYEFAARPIPEIMSGGSERLMREWKELQMGLVGSNVALVRCHTHENAILNLTFGGTITESRGIDWETNFKDVLDPLDLAFGRLLAKFIVGKTLILPKRSDAVAADLIDLSDYYNRGLQELRPQSGFAPSTNPVSGDIVVMDGVPFDVRGAVQLRALRPGLIPYPSDVNGIYIGRPARGVQFLVATAFEAVAQTVVAECVFHLADNREERRPLRYGRDVFVGGHAGTGPASAPELTTRAEHAQTGEPARFRFSRCQWTNPFPGQEVKSMDFVSRNGNAGALLFALTVEGPP